MNIYTTLIKVRPKWWVEKTRYPQARKGRWHLKIVIRCFTSVIQMFVIHLQILNQQSVFKAPSWPELVYTPKSKAGQLNNSRLVQISDPYCILLVLWLASIQIFYANQLSTVYIFCIFICKKNLDQGPHSQCSLKEIPKFLQNFRLQYNILTIYFQRIF